MATIDSLNKLPSDFIQAMKFLTPWEGGFVNHPNDPGGATNRGVTQNVYNGYRKKKGLPIQTVRNITTPEVYDIYYNQYWLASNCDKIPAPLNIVVFDRAVNMGTGQAIKLLQQSLNKLGKGLVVDGGFGANSLKAVQSMSPNSIIKACELMVQESLNFRELLIKRNNRLSVFRNGWRNRDLALGKYAKGLFSGNPSDIA
jgi:lysozyme family protein